MIDTLKYEQEFDAQYEDKTMIEVSIPGLTPVVAQPIFGTAQPHDDIGTIEDIDRAEKKLKYEAEKAEYIFQKALSEHAYEDVEAALGIMPGYFPCDDYSKQCRLDCLLKLDCPKVEKSKPQNEEMPKKQKRKRKRKSSR